MATRNFTRARPAAEASSASQLVRARFGLTQQQLATWLGVSRTALAMDDHGTRDLPPAALKRLVLLAQALADPAPAPPAVLSAPAPLDARQREALAQRLRASKLAEQPLRQQLGRVQALLAQAHQRQQAEPTLRAALPATDAAGHRWLSRFAEEADDWLRADSATPALLELRLRVLAFERAELEQLLSLGPPPAA